MHYILQIFQAKQAWFVYFECARLWHGSVLKSIVTETCRQVTQGHATSGLLQYIQSGLKLLVVPLVSHLVKVVCRDHNLSTVEAELKSIVPDEHSAIEEYIRQITTITELPNPEELVRRTLMQFEELAVLVPQKENRPPKLVFFDTLIDSILGVLRGCEKENSMRASANGLSSEMTLSDLLIEVRNMLSTPEKIPILKAIEIVENDDRLSKLFNVDFMRRLKHFTKLNDAWL